MAVSSRRRFILFVVLLLLGVPLAGLLGAEAIVRVDDWDWRLISRLVPTPPMSLRSQWPAPTRGS